MTAWRIGGSQRKGLVVGGTRSVLDGPDAGAANAVQDEVPVCVRRQGGGATIQNRRSSPWRLPVEPARSGCRVGDIENPARCVDESNP